MIGSSSSNKPKRRSSLLPAALPHCWLSAGNRRQSLNAAQPTTDNAIVSPTSDLYDLVVDMNWHRVIRHCRSHPINAEYQDSETLETPLHVACQHNPSVRVISGLLQASRMACETPSASGDLPLHIACQSGASIGVLRELTQTHPEIAKQQNGNGKTALQVLWEGRDTTESNRTKENYNSVFWQKVHVLLEAVARSRQKEQGLKKGDGTKLYILHAAVSLGLSGCPREILEYCLHRYHHQIAQRDAWGRLPLHIAVGLNSETTLSSSCNYSCKKQQQSAHKYYTHDQNPMATIGMLLAAYPRAARIPDPNEPVGRYPLHSALANHHAWHTGVEELLEDAPEVIAMPDPVSGLLPYLSAAAAPPSTSGTSCSASLVDLDSIYRVLRALPSALDAELAAQDPCVETNNRPSAPQEAFDGNDDFDATERTMDETETCFEDVDLDQDDALLLDYVIVEVKQEPPTKQLTTKKATTRLTSKRSSRTMRRRASLAASPIRLPRIQKADHRELCDDAVTRVASSGLFGAMRQQRRSSVG